MGAQHKVSCGRMLLDVVDRNGWKGLTAGFDPVSSVVDAHVHGLLSAAVQNVRVPKIFPHDLDGATSWKIAGDVRPRLAPVVRGQDARVIVVSAVPVDAGVSPALGVRTRHESGD